MRRLPLAIAALAGLVGGGCFNYSVGNGQVRCDPADMNACPPRFHCAADRTCWPNGQGPTLDLAGSDPSARDMSPDLKPIVMGSAPAAVWMSSGGGSPASGALQLNISVAGANAPGAATAGSAAASFGYFASDGY